MKKRTGWLWSLGASIAFVISTVMTLTNPVYDNMTKWWLPAGLAIIFAVLTVWLRSSAKKEEEAYLRQQQRKQEEQQRKQEEEQRQREELAARIKEHRERFRKEKFPVAGVTFKNDDGSDRQKILREIALNNDGTCSVFFDEDDELGEDSAIRVMTEFGQVGHIRRSDKKNIRRFFENMVNSIYLDVERFESDEGEKIYRADVVVTMDKSDPEQSWYFDDLPESEV